MKALISLACSLTLLLLLRTSIFILLCEISGENKKKKENEEKWFTVNILCWYSFTYRCKHIRSVFTYISYEKSAHLCNNHILFKFSDWFLRKIFPNANHWDWMSYIESRILHNPLLLLLFLYEKKRIVKTKDIKSFFIHLLWNIPFTRHEFFVIFLSIVLCLLSLNNTWKFKYWTTICHSKISIKFVTLLNTMQNQTTTKVRTMQKKQNKIHIDL